MACKFFEMLDARWAEGARVCVGLDPQLDRIPDSIKNSKRSSSPQLEFNVKIIDATKDLALCYKPNLAFYKGPEGLHALRNTVAHIRTAAPGIPIILDAKYADIGNTNLGYVQNTFDWLSCDAVTVHNYMGQEAMKPFLDRVDKGIIVVCKTSNAGSREFQDIIVEMSEASLKEISQTLRVDHDDVFIPKRTPMYMYVAWRARVWNCANNNVALVVGATYPDHVSDVRSIVDDMPILLPGMGAQGGDIKTAIRAGINSKGAGLIPSSSSGIIFADDPKAATQMLTDEINAVLEKALA